MVKNLPAMWEVWVRSLGWEDFLEKEMTIHSSTLVWKIPWTEESVRLQPMGSQRVRHDWATELNWTECDVTVVVVTLSWDFCLDSWYETFVNSPGIFWVDNLDEQMDPSLNGLINSWCFPGASDSKESTCNAGDLGLILGLGRSPGKGNSYPLQYSCLENSMDRGAWWLQSMGSQRIRHD